MVLAALLSFQTDSPFLCFMGYLWCGSIAESILIFESIVTIIWIAEAYVAAVTLMLFE